MGLNDIIKELSCETEDKIKVSEDGVVTVM